MKEKRRSKWICECGIKWSGSILTCRCCDPKTLTRKLPVKVKEETNVR